MANFLKVGASFWLTYIPTYITMQLSVNTVCIQPAPLNPLFIFVTNAGMAIALALAENVIRGITLIAMAVWGAFAGVVSGNVISRHFTNNTSWSY